MSVAPFVQADTGIVCFPVWAGLGFLPLTLKPLLRSISGAVRVAAGGGKVNGCGTRIVNLLEDRGI